MKSQMFAGLMLSLLFTGSWQKGARHVEVPGSNTSAVLDDLEPITAYHLRVLSVNKFGRSEPSPMISVTTDEEGK